MIRAQAKNPDVVLVEISGLDWRSIQEEKDRFKAEVPAADRYWNGTVWVITKAQKFQHLWYVDHALRQIMKQLPLEQTA